MKRASVQNALAEVLDSANNSKEFQSLYLGLAQYIDVRELQNKLVAMRIDDSLNDVWIFCEHPDVITIGKRTSAAERSALGLLAADLGMETYEVDRGGEATYHGPGQLICYPIVDLRARGFGVKGFVSKSLDGIAEFLQGYGIRVISELEQAGVWVESINEESRQKIASVGLRIQKGVTNHGFSINIQCNLDVFSRFNPCGLSGLNVTSVLAQEPLVQDHELLTAADNCMRALAKQCYALDSKGA
jgi:lipoyl(octanoyl) transferase